MADWRDAIFKALDMGYHRLILAADPDALLLEPRILESLRRKGYTLLPYDDPIEFRYLYESRFRSHWDAGEPGDAKLVVRLPESDLSVLPYDLWQIGRKVSLSLADIFPNLSYRVVAQLDVTTFDALDRACQRHRPRSLGEHTTRAFILTHVFHLDPDAIHTPEELLHALLQRHYERYPLPPALEQYLIERLQRKDQFHEWPLDRLITDREAFFDFLQERWPIFLQRLLSGDSPALHEGVTPMDLTYPGPGWLPLDDPQVRVFIDTLFVEGRLQPVPFPQAEQLANSWVRIGIETSPQANRLARLEKLLPAVQDAIPDREASHVQWLHFAFQWAELTNLVHTATDPLPQAWQEAYHSLVPRVDAAILAWTQAHYQALIQLPPSPPVMLHHIPRHLQRILEDDPRAKIALLVLDGLALAQWITLRETLQRQATAWRLHEQTVFAWIPTITPVSRQALFAGKAPLFFAKDMHTTAREDSHWRAFWRAQGLQPSQIAYLKGLGDKGDLKRIDDLLSGPKLRVAGLVVNKVDDIMHGMELGAAGMHNQVRQWGEQGFLQELLTMLHARGFQIFLTSDHGNIEATGIGQPREGAIADVRGARVRIYNDEGLRERVHQAYPHAIPWPPIGLPERYLPLLAPARSAFAPKDKRLVGHGGVSVEELIVPFIQVKHSEK